MEASLSGVERIVVQDRFLVPTARQADIVSSVVAVTAAHGTKIAERPRAGLRGLGSCQCMCSRHQREPAQHRLRGGEVRPGVVDLYGSGSRNVVFSFEI